MAKRHKAAENDELEIEFTSIGQPDYATALRVFTPLVIEMYTKKVKPLKEAATQQEAA
jgi:hypothetical protein